MWLGRAACCLYRGTGAGSILIKKEFFYVARVLHCLVIDRIYRWPPGVCAQREAPAETASATAAPATMLAPGAEWEPPPLLCCVDLRVRRILAHTASAG